MTQGSENETESFISWSIPRAAPQVSSPLLHEGRLYTLHQGGGIINCLDAATGKQLYRKRLPGAGGFTSSPWAARGHVFCLDENGQTFVIAPGPEINVLETNELTGMFWSSPAITGRGLLLRSSEHLYCISSRK